MNRRQVLRDLVVEHGWIRGAELGVYFGDTLFHLLDHCPALTMIGVDLWEPTVGTRAHDAEHGHCDLSFRPMADAEQAVRLKAPDYGPRLRLIKADTVAAADHVADGSLDFVFIDANHTTEGVTRDVAAWRQKVRPGGMLCGHDLSWPSVRRALDRVLPGYKETDGDVWLWRV